MIGLSRLAALAPAALAVSGCVYANAGVETFSIRAELGLDPVVETRSASLRLSATEIAYARDTARLVFKRRGGERSTGFVSANGEGYALCLRSAGEYALLVFQRRVFEASIPQAADDAAILRTAADTAVCRTVDGWTPV